MPLGVPIVWNPYRITPIHSFSRCLLILVNAPSAAQIYPPSRIGHISPSVAIFLAWFQSLSLTFFICTSATAVVELCSPCGEVPWNIVAVSLHVLASSQATTLTVCKMYGFFECTWGCFRYFKIRILRKPPSQKLNSSLNIYILVLRHATPFPSD